MAEFNRANGGVYALSYARTLTGLEYVYGGDGPPGGVDCSRLVQWAWGKVGVHLPRDTEDQYQVCQLNERILNSEPGDLLFSPGDPFDPNPGHVVMYVSPGVCFQAEETGTRVGTFPWDTDSWEFRTRPSFTLPAVSTPPHPLPAGVGRPTKQALINAGVVLLPNVAAAEVAIHNGWTLWYWSATHFVAQEDGDPRKVALYANAHYRQKRS
jgi:cell wall-associated NlpC family hydrolase